MKILLVGNGAREHAIAWKLAQSPQVKALFIAPGNAGTSQVGQNISIGPTDIHKLLGFAKEERIDLTVIGPEAPLAEGIANCFHVAGMLIFGPTREAALIESSKSFAKDLMVEHEVPTGRYRTFSSYDSAAAYLRDESVPVVVKADGLAAGKGVAVAQTPEEALEALRQRMEQKVFGSAGEKVLIEEYLEGQEVSAFAFVDGEYVSTMVAACDYKRIGDGDVGPNTGGMGSYSPPPMWTHALECRVREEIMEPVAQALVAYGSPYQGVLYAGLMVTAGGPKVIEFNCRLGDPETQVILPLLKTDLAEVMMRTAQGRLDSAPIEWESRACVGVVVASGGYPDQYVTGYPIEGLDMLDQDITLFHAGTKTVRDRQGGNSTFMTDGGRVLTVTSIANTLNEARQRVYANVERIRFESSYYRRDIAAP